jgi:5'-3' exonuclease
MLMVTLRLAGIHPVVVFDGYSPIAKQRTKKRRASQREDNAAKLDQLTVALDAWTSAHGDATHMDPEQLSLLQSVTTAANQRIGNALVTDAVDPCAIEQRIQALKKSASNITHESVHMAKAICQVLCIPVYVARGEAETDLAIMLHQNRVDVVLTRDSDIFAYDVPKFMIDINVSKRTCTLVHMRDVYDMMNLTPATFRDLCIMCGTDYNDNIPGIGVSKALKLLKQHTTIEGILRATTMDCSCLSHVQVRDIFSVGASPTTPPLDKCCIKCAPPTEDLLAERTRLLVSIGVSRVSRELRGDI